MEFCVISPTAGLEKYATLSHYHLVLAHIADPTYVKFYQERQREGDHIMLDNGAYEGRFDEKTLLEAIHVYEPDVLVLPDFYLQKWQKTWHAAQAFLDQFNEELPQCQFCYVPQAAPGDVQGFIESYNNALMDDRISWIGLPRALVTHIQSDPLARVNIAKFILRDKPGIRVHAFGMCNGDVHELPYLAHAGVTSVDSSAPVWRGWKGYSMCNRDRKRWDSEGTAVDFTAPYDDIKAASILNNLEACGVDTRT